jgi:hypothetical protein
VADPDRPVPVWMDYVCEPLDLLRSDGSDLRIPLQLSDLIWGDGSGSNGCD